MNSVISSNGIMKFQRLHNVQCSCLLRSLAEWPATAGEGKSSIQHGNFPLDESGFAVIENSHYASRGPALLFVFSSNMRSATSMQIIKISSLVSCL